MIQLFMKRSGSPVIVPLNLPASHDAMTEAASQLDEASRAGKTEIVEIKSVITNLPSYLGGLDPDSRTQLAQLNQLSSIIAKMDSRERDIYAGALDGNSINNLNDMIRVAEQVSDYILIPNVSSDVTLGRYVAVAGQIQGDPRFPEAAWPYLDFSKIGAEYYAEHGGAYCRQLENKERRITNISECEILPDGSRRLHKLYEYNITENRLEGDRFIIEGHHQKCEEMSASLQRRFIENGMPRGELEQFIQRKEETA